LYKPFLLGENMLINTNSNLKIKETKTELKNKDDILFLVDFLENNKGMFLSSGTEYPGRYSRWETGFYNPPVEVIAYFDRVIFQSLNLKGKELIKIFYEILSNSSEYDLIKEENNIIAKIKFSSKIFKEEDRSKQPSVLSPIRKILEFFKHNEKTTLGFYGAFGFDLLFQFDKIDLINKRNPNQPIARLFFPDVIYSYDRKKEVGYKFEYDFEYKNYSTINIQNKTIEALKIEKDNIKIIGNINSTLTDEQYAQLVDEAKKHMEVGDVFELVLRRRFYAKYQGLTSALFLKMIEINPSPYQFFCQFEDEQLIGTSPEMFVRVTGNRVESCPISGTIKRGKNAIEDEIQIKKLLNSQKDEVELTMCTDVDRNDKSRICKAGTIKLLGRRQIEKYKGLFHTVDHVEGILRDDCSSIDAFLSHMWAVTLMGSPKSSASRLIEKYENEPRDYYGGAIGALFCNGNMNTGITIRTIHLKDGIANYSAGASLVYDSVGIDEAIETKIKANSFFNIFNPSVNEVKIENEPVGTGLKVLVIDNLDSFVNTLSDYFRQTNADVVTYRCGVDLSTILSEKPDLILHSPGPKLPKDFNMHYYVKELTKLNIAQFGVCLGLQGIVETFGGKLEKIKIPQQGKKWIINHNSKSIFEGIKSPIEAGAYHSWVASFEDFPSELEIIAKCELDYIMAIAHKNKAIWGVQFHPESIMSNVDDFGHKLIENVTKLTRKNKNERNS